MRKSILISIVLVLISFGFIGNNVVYADPMDPLNAIQAETKESSETGESIDKNTPDIVVNENDNVKDNMTDIESAEDLEEQEKNRKAVQFMDSVLYLIGVAGILIPIIYLGVYLGARIFPTLFLPLFRFFTKGEVLPEDIPWYIAFLRTLPVAILGMTIATGRIKILFSAIWSFVEERFLK